MILYIKNMVCSRCILVVRQQLENLGFQVSDISLGSAEILPEPDEDAVLKISSVLNFLGFELISKEKDRLIERIKSLVIERVHHSDLSENPVSFTEFIASHLNKDYTYLSKLFSESENTTIEKFIIQQKVEKVKELLDYGELNLNEIADKMGYSSSAHLSAQFKNITGFTPRQFKSLERVDRKPIDKI